MSRRTPYLMIDSSWMAYRARYAIPDLSYNEMPTGILFGFWEQLRTLLTNEIIQSNKAMFFVDSYISTRKKTYKTYKKKRHEEKTEEEINEIRIMYKQLNILVKDVLPSVGFPVYHQVGLESDDLMAAMAEACDRKKERGILITGDKDLLQCISPNIAWYNPVKWEYLNLKKFRKEYGIEPEQWGDVKAIAGCNSDEVEGIQGVGEKTAIKYIRGELPEHYKAYQKIESKEGQKIIRRNEKLVKLPHRRTRKQKLPKFNFNPSVFFDFCKKYGLQLFMSDKRLKQWQDIFNGQVNVLQKQESRTRRRK